MAIDPQAISLQMIEEKHRSDVAQGQQLSGLAQRGFSHVQQGVQDVRNAQKDAQWNQLLNSGIQGLSQSADEVGFPNPEALFAIAKQGKTGLVQAYSMLNQWNTQQRMIKKEDVAAAGRAEVERQTAEFSKRGQELLASGKSDRDIAMGFDALQLELPKADKSLAPSFSKKQDGTEALKGQTKLGERKFVAQSVKDINKQIYGKEISDVDAVKAASTSKRLIEAWEKDKLFGLDAVTSLIPKRLLSTAGGILDKAGVDIGKKMRAVANDISSNKALREEFVFAYQKMISGVAVSQQEQERIRNMMASQIGEDPIAFMKFVNKRNQELKAAVKARQNTARIINPGVYDQMKAAGGIIDVDSIPDLDELIAKMEAEYTGRTTGTQEAKTSTVSREEALKAAADFLGGQ
jgi:hypothetical protein